MSSRPQTRHAAPQETLSRAGTGKRRGRRAALAIAACALTALPLLLIGSGSVCGADLAEDSSTTRTDAALPHRIIFGQVPAMASSGKHTGSPGLDPTAGLPDKSRIVAFDPTNRARGVANLTAEFSAAGRPDVSFDGKRILFVGRRTQEARLNVWEMNADGTSVRQITDRPTDCLAAIYLSTIYTIDADRPVYQIAFLSFEEAGGLPSLYTCRLDGTRTARITFNPYGVFDPWQLSDGRLLFSSRQAPSAKQGLPDAAALFTVQTDGADVFVFAAAHEPPARRGMPCETPDGSVVYVESSAGGSDPGGALVTVSRSRSLHTRRAVTTDPTGRYHSPSALPDGRLLVSYRPLADTPYEIHLLDLTTGQRITKVFEERGWHSVDAIAAHPRPEPAGRASVVDDRVKAGLLYCMNAYLSDRNEAANIGAGQISRVQVFTAGNADEADSGTVRANSAKAPPDGEELLGDAPVDPDGSFYLELPPRTPIRLQTVDKNGAILQHMDSWIWVMPRESRGCIGCHEDRELTPPNRHVLALRKPPTKIGVSGDRAYVPVDKRESRGDRPE